MGPALKGIAGIAAAVAAPLYVFGIVSGDLVAIASAILTTMAAVLLWWLSSKNGDGGTPMNRDGGIDTGGGDINAQNVAARDINITQHASEAAVVMDGWEDEPGAPRFRIHQASSSFPDRVEQNMTFDLIEGGPIGGLRARYRAPGLAMEPVKPMDQNKPGSYQMKGVALPAVGQPDSELGEGKVGFEIQFNWQGAERHIMWVAPLKLHEKGFWRADWKAQPERFWSMSRP